MGGTALVRIEQITEEEADMLRQGIDPDERIDISQVDTSEFDIINLLDKKVEADSKVFLEFDSEAENPVFPELMDVDRVGD